MSEEMSVGEISFQSKNFTEIEQEMFESQSNNIIKYKLMKMVLK